MDLAAAAAGICATRKSVLWAGRSGGRTEREYSAASGRHDHATFRVRANVSVRSPGLGARLLATYDETRAGWYVARLYSVLIFCCKLYLLAPAFLADGHICGWL